MSGLRNGSFDYRIRIPLAAGMAPLGHDVSWGNGIDRHMLEHGGIVVSQYLASKRELMNWQHLASTGKHVLIYDVDDDIWEAGNQEAAGATYRDPAAIKRINEIIESAHLVTTTTEYLSQRIQDRTSQSRVVVLPNCVPEKILKGAPSTLDPLGPDQPVLGYTSAPGHSNDVLRWSGIWTDWMSGHRGRSPQVAFWGIDLRPKGIPPTWRCTFLPWQQYEFYLRSLSASVGVCPLDPMNLFARGRSGIKAVEWMARGIPVVAQALPMYEAVVKHGVTGYLARTEADYGKHLRRLARSADLRATLGQNARDHVRANFTIENRIDEWVTAYSTIARIVGIELEGKTA